VAGAADDYQVNQELDKRARRVVWEFHIVSRADITLPRRRFRFAQSETDNSYKSTQLNGGLADSQPPSVPEAV
jgi:hypothetical protein